VSVKPALNPFPEGLPEDLPAAATAAQLAAIETELSEASGATGSGPKLVHDGPELARLSRDCFDYSPVLQPLLSGRLAQLVVKASRLEEVLAVAKACSRQGVPLTLRGSGTGNYGQCVPLAGGVVLDLSGLNRMRQLEASSGIVTAEAGCLLADLDRQLSVSGRSLRLAPSTWRSATVAGFIAGGSGGIGSLRWGFLRDPGNLIGLELVTLEAEPACSSSMEEQAGRSTMPTEPTASSRRSACPPPPP